MGYVEVNWATYQYNKALGQKLRQRREELGLTRGQMDMRLSKAQYYGLGCMTIEENMATTGVTAFQLIAVATAYELNACDLLPTQEQMMARYKKGK